MEYIAAIRQFAVDNYNKDGWDVLVECWSDADILQTIGKCKSEKAAIDRCRKTLKAYDEYRREIQATAF